MGRLIYVRVILLTLVAFLFSCNSNVHQVSNSIGDEADKVIQQADGSISLKVDKADCYSDMSNPSSNTAEWNVLVSKSGRFNVWLSSATKDTTDLKYSGSVLFSVKDNRLEAKPGCDNIVLNSSEVSYPYFRADSFIGSLFIQDTGLYNIQLISEQIHPNDLKTEESATSDNSKLLSVLLTPVSR
jgi:hypothetical protein